MTATMPRRRRRRALLAALAAFVAILTGYAVYTNVSPYTLQASIEIRATPEQVWAVLADTADYPAWNPFIVRSSGPVRVGATLTNVMHDATGNTTFTPTVLVAEPGHELRWVGRVPPGGIFTGTHTFTIEQVRPGVVLLTQREDFTGVAVPFYEHWLHADTLPMFKAMNEALAHRVTGG